MLGAGELSVDDKRTTRLEATISKPQVICCLKDSVLLGALCLQP